MSGKQQRKSHGIGKSKGSGKDKSVRKQRASELGRALRSVYDDTLREPVPDDFGDLLGKLN